MSTPPISFRYPFESEIAKLPPDMQRVHRTTWNAITDLQNAIPFLKGQIDNLKSGTSGTGSTTENVTSQTVQIIQQVSPSIGAVNDQAGVTAYTTLQSDYGSEIQFNDTSPITVTLSTLSTNPGIQLPWFTTINNLGTGIATLTPASPALINGNASLALPGSEFAIVYFDGTNFTAGIGSSVGGVIQLIAGTGVGISPSGGQGIVTVSNTGVTQVVAGTNVTLSPVGGTGVVTINSSGGGGGSGNLNTTRTDKTGTYLSGVTYTNSTSSSVYEEVTLTATGSGTGCEFILTSSINGLAGPTQWITNDGRGACSIGFWVPSGDTFSATATQNSGGAQPFSISKWTEDSFTLGASSTTFTRGGTILNPTAAITVVVWYAPFAATVTHVLGYVSGATGSVINAQRNGSLPLLVSNLTLSSSGTWMDGGAVQNTAISAGDELQIVIVSVSGTPTQIAVEIQCTEP
jgi:hypothetical protein